MFNNEIFQKVALDTTFGNGVLLLARWMLNVINDLVLQYDGKIVLGGSILYSMENTLLLENISLRDC